MLDPLSSVTLPSCRLRRGPNNLLLATSGVNFGMRRTLPMVFGILVGCALQTVIAGVALEVLLHWMAAIRLPLTLAGCAYLLWLSWKIFRAAAPEVRSKPQPMTLLGGACFRAINPKAADGDQCGAVVQRQQRRADGDDRLYAAEPALHSDLGCAGRSPAQPSADCPEASVI